MEAAMAQLPAKIHQIIRQVTDKEFAKNTAAPEQERSHDQQQPQEQQSIQGPQRLPEHTLPRQLWVWLQEQQRRSVEERQQLLLALVSRILEQLPGAPRKLLLVVLSACLFQHDLRQGAQLALQRAPPHAEAHPAPAHAVSANHPHAAVASRAVPRLSSTTYQLMLAAHCGLAAVALRQCAGSTARAPCDDAPTASQQLHTALPASPRSSRSEPCRGPANAAHRTIDYSSSEGTTELTVRIPSPYLIRTQSVHSSSNTNHDSIAIPRRESASASTVRANIASLQQVQNGLDKLIASLRPSLAVTALIQAAFNRLDEACTAVEPEWQATMCQCGVGTRALLAGVKIVGSCANGTNMSKGSDLDVLVQLRCSPAQFPSAKRHFMKLLDRELSNSVACMGSNDLVHGSSSSSSRPNASASLDQLWATEWRLAACVPAYYLRYFVSGLQVDVQVARYRGTKEELRLHSRYQIRQLIQEAASGEAGNDDTAANMLQDEWSSASSAVAASTCNDASSGRDSLLCSKRQRVTEMTELQTDMFVGIERSHGKAVARMVRDVILVMKALVANGLVVQGGCDRCKEVIPGSALEHIVVWAFDLNTEQHGKEKSAPTALTLLLNVLATVSVHLRPVRDGQDAPIIAVPRHYSWADLLNPCVHKHWGSGRLFTPSTINTCDPMYNCTAYINFRNWDGFADACHHLLHRVFDAVALPASDDAWHVLCNSSCLGAAVAAYRRE